MNILYTSSNAVKQKLQIMCLAAGDANEKNWVEQSSRDQQ